jgi:sugar phosphate isomerase/epimerase
MLISRRKFVASAAAAASVAAFAQAAHTCPFRVAVINDEISQDFDHVCSVVAHDFGLQWIELRSMWGKNVTELPDADLQRARTILSKYNLRVTDIASPLFKTDWPGAPISKQSERRDNFKADFTFKQQQDLLDHCVMLAKTFGTDRIRCFDFWRLDNVAPYRVAINEKLREAARRCARSNLILILENEMSCNTATGEEAADTLRSVSEANFMLNWDPGNAATFPNSEPFPKGYDLLPKKANRSLPRQKCSPQAGRKMGVGAGRHRSSGLGRSACRASTRWLSLRRKPGNALARRRDP